MGDLGELSRGISKRAYYELEVLSSIIHLIVYQMYWGYLGGISIEDGFSYRKYLYIERYSIVMRYYRWRNVFTLLDFFFQNQRFF